MTEQWFDRVPAPLRRPVVFDQRWRNVTFLHWPVEPAAVAPLFPAGCRPDLVDGLSYVGLVPFELRRATIGAGPAVPYFGSFAETNIRLYSVDDAGRHGVVFRSLDTERLAILPIARLLFGVPYAWSRMRVERQAGVVAYDSQRRLPRRGLSSAVTVRISEPIQASPLERWLTARWGLHARIGGRTRWVPNSHGPWPLHEASVLELRDDLLAASGVVPCGPRLRALWSPGVRTRFGLPITLD